MQQMLSIPLNRMDYGHRAQLVEQSSLFPYREDGRYGLRLPMMPVRQACRRVAGAVHRHG
jgi:hypothetical protein